MKPSSTFPGQRYGSLTVIRQDGVSKDKHRMWLCSCDCGGEKTVPSNVLKLKRHHSCGCMTQKLNGDAHRKHGMHGSPTYRSWQAMLRRCHVETDKDYPRYGAQGVRVCDEWRESFEAFFAYLGTRPNGTTVDRIKNHLGYEPGNVRWATDTTQVRNRRKSTWILVGDVRMHLSEYAEKIGISFDAAYMRLKRGKLEGAQRA